MEISSVNSFLDYYEKIRGRTKRLLLHVRPEHLGFRYMPGKFSVADEIRHIAAIERFMFAETIAGRKSAYVGCGPELAADHPAIMTFFEDMHEESVAIFRSLSDEDLQRNCSTPGNAVMPVWKWLRAMVEHEIHHRAQLYLYLNMLHVKTPPIFGLSAEEVAENAIMSHGKNRLDL